MRTATLGSVLCLPSNIDRFLSRQPIAVRRGASENAQNSQLQVLQLEEGGTLCCDGDRAEGRVNQDDNAGHDPAVRAAHRCRSWASDPADCPGGSTGSSRPSASLRANRALLRGGALLWTTWTIRYQRQLPARTNVPPKKCGFRPAF